MTTIEDQHNIPDYPAMARIEARLAAIEALLFGTPPKKIRLTYRDRKAEEEAGMAWDDVVELAKCEVCSRFKLARADFDGRPHPEDVAWARFYAIHLARRFTPLSTKRIGALITLGGKPMDHVNVLHALKRVRDRASVSPFVRATIATLEESFSRSTGLTPREV